MANTVKKIFLSYTSSPVDLLLASTDFFFFQIVHTVQTQNKDCRQMHSPNFFTTAVSSFFVSPPIVEEADKQRVHSSSLNIRQRKTKRRNTIQNTNATLVSFPLSLPFDLAGCHAQFSKATQKGWLLDCSCICWLQNYFFWQKPSRKYTEKLPKPSTTNVLKFQWFPLYMPSYRLANDHSSPLFFTLCSNSRDQPKSAGLGAKA